MVLDMHGVLIDPNRFYEDGKTIVFVETADETSLGIQSPSVGSTRTDRYNARGAVEYGASLMPIRLSEVPLHVDELRSKARWYEKKATELEQSRGTEQQF